MELENAEFEQRYWLPAYQRIEAQAGFSLLGDQRAVFRVVSRFRSLVVNPTDSMRAASAGALAATDSARPAVGDSLRLTVHRLTFAPRDSIDHYADWSRAIGEQTGAVRADDFSDVAPDPWRPSGRPIVRLWFYEPSDLFHYNRVEGVCTGLAGEARFRDAAPGVVIRGNAGRAWGEETMRGRLSVERQRGHW